MCVDQSAGVQVSGNWGPLASNQKDPLQIADNISLVEFGRDEAGLIITTSGGGPPLLLPPEGYTGMPTTSLSSLQIEKAIRWQKWGMGGDAPKPGGLRM